MWRGGVGNWSCWLAKLTLGVHGTQGVRRLGKGGDLHAHVLGPMERGAVLFHVALVCLEKY